MGELVASTSLGSQARLTGRLTVVSNIEKRIPEAPSSEERGLFWSPPEEKDRGQKPSILARLSKFIKARLLGRDHESEDEDMISDLEPSSDHDLFQGLEEADIILLGAQRTTKRPTAKHLIKEGFVVRCHTRSRRPKHELVGMTGSEIMTTRILALVAAVACSFGGTAASATNLNSFDPVALRDTVEATAKELMLPGTMILLRTPQGEFVFGYGATELGGSTPLRADTHFRIASNTKTMTAAVIVLLAQEEKLRFDDPSRNMYLAFPMATTSPSAGSLRCGPARAWTTDELLAIAFKHPPVFAPGTRVLQHQLCAARSHRGKA